jgi:hypothetical protein
VWDSEGDGYLRGEKLAKPAVMIGLAPNKEHFYKLLSLVLNLQRDGIGRVKVSQ